MTEAADHYVVYEPETGEPLFGGGDRSRSYALEAGSDAAMMWVPQAAVLKRPIDLDPVRAMLLAEIDAEAEAARSPYLTAGEGQAMTYLYKADEARSWLTDHDAEVPFLAAEAAARGMALDDLAAEVVAAVVAWRRIGAAIEAGRIRAKAAITAANNFRDLAAARAVDWSAIIAAA